jgi:DNA-binding IclR family transcriptional regulator
MAGDIVQIGIMKTKAAKPGKLKPEYAVPALDKGLDVLETLAASAVPQSLSELARSMGQTPSALFRLLSRLERRSFVVRDSVSGRYSLSLKLLELAHTHSPVEHIIRASASPMRELAESVRESVHLSVLDCRRLIVLLDVGSPLRIRFTHEVGGQFPPVLTNSGRLLLAYLSPEDLEELLSKDPEYARFSSAGRDALREELRNIRRNRHAISASEERAGMKDLAVLVGNPAMGVTAALAIACLSGGKDKADIIRLITALKECAARITNGLGVSYDRSPIL